jgi:hypothetical protein
MRETLINKLHEYIRENNPDILFQLEKDSKVSQYLSEKLSTVSSLINLSDKGQPAYIIEDACMDVLTQDLRPSKYNYICNILDEEFGDTFQQLIDNGLLQFEAVNLVNHCQSIFEDLQFSEENEGNQFLRYAIIGTISEYRERNVTSEKENVSNELQQSTETEG